MHMAPSLIESVYRAQQHINSITYGETETYPGQMDPLLIKPSAPEPNYTE